MEVVYHDLAKPDESLPDEIARQLAEQHLPFPVTVMDGEIVSSGDVSYFALADRLKRLQAAS